MLLLLLFLYFTAVPYIKFYSPPPLTIRKPISKAHQIDQEASDLRAVVSTLMEENNELWRENGALWDAVRALQKAVQDIQSRS